MKKILITGGSGFIGTELISQLLREKFIIHCLDINKPKIKKNKKLKFYKGNLFDRKIIQRAMSGCEIVIHLAAYLGVENTDKNVSKCLDENIYGTKLVIDIAKKYKVKSFIFSSSSEVYGDQSKFPIKENAELKNKSVYGSSKIIAEHYVRDSFNKINQSHIIVRFFNVYGLNQKENFVIKKFIKKIKNNKSLTVYGKGNQVRSFCYVSDSVNALIKLIKLNVKNQTFNIGNPCEPISMKKLASKIIKISKKKIKIKHVSFDKSDRSKDREIFKRIPCINKIKSKINYVPKVSLAEGIKKILQRI